MKKHIKKKFMFEVALSEDTASKINASGNSIPLENMPALKKFPKDLNSFLITEKNVAFQAFPYTYQGQVRFIPEPDLVLVYFHSAYVNYRLIEEKKKVILNALLGDKMGEPMINELYEYFGLTSGFVIFLFTAMEAFVNRCINADYTYTRPGKKSTETFNKKQIEEWFTFTDKIKIILPEVRKRNFAKQYPLKYQHIVNLKEFRDSIVHTKASTEGHTPYDYLYKRALELKYEETINAVADFCNYYYPESNYIEECPCNQDW
jgi:hypothetical protein